MIILLLIGIVSSIQTTGYSKRWLDQPHAMTLLNDPANSIQIQSCPVVQGHQLTPLLLSLGYLKQNCRGYTHHYLSSSTMNNQEQQLQKFNEMVLNKVSTFDEFYKLRVIDRYEIKLTADNRIVQINAVFAHPRNSTHNSTANRKEYQGNFTRSLVGRGLHQQLQYQFMLPPHLDIHDECVLVLSGTTTHEYYIDLDEFTNMSSFEPIDIEKPSFLNKQYYWQWSVAVSQLTKLDSAYNLSHRIHFRYQAASTNEYQRVIIPRDTTAEFRCPEGTYTFQDIQQNVLVTNVPVGNKSNERTVVFMTLVVTICSSMFISKAIRQRKLVS